MSQLNAEYKKKLIRKRMRNITFDSYRDFDENSSKHCDLRELLQTFYNILIDLSKCVRHCEEDSNSRIVDEVENVLVNNRALLEKTCSNNFNLPQFPPTINASLNSTKKMRLIPNVHSLLETVEDPCLFRFICSDVCDAVENFDLKNCLDRLKREAKYLLQLSNVYTECKNRKNYNEDKISYVANNDLKLDSFQNVCNIRSKSFNEQCSIVYAEDKQNISNRKAICSFTPDFIDILYKYEKTFTINKFAEVYEHSILNPSEGLAALDNFSKLQSTARNVLSTPIKYKDNNGVIVLLQIIEDFCREGDKIVESFKKCRDDLQSQISAADKQLKATRQFLDEQAGEREQEHDDFLSEIKRLENQICDKEKEIILFENANKGLEFFEDQTRELMQKLIDSNNARDKFEIELKATIDKIFVLREIISELESQIETKSLTDRMSQEKITQLEDKINTHVFVNDKLQKEVQSLKNEIVYNYQMKIQVLEEQLRNMRPSAEQNIVLEKLVEQLHAIEITLDQKTKSLESMHHSNLSNSCSEDISAQCAHPIFEEEIVKLSEHCTEQPSPRQLSLSMQSVDRIFERLVKHSRIEDSIFKYVQDRDMEIIQIRKTSSELQQERDSLQELVLGQTQRIAVLQLRIDEQRQRNEEILRAGTSNLNIQIHDMKMEVPNFSETLELRDKHIIALKEQLENSKFAIDRMEDELSIELKPKKSLIDQFQADVNQKNSEIKFLKDRIKTDMINKLALPDLMETMLADKNEEIDHLKEQLKIRERELKATNELSQVCFTRTNEVKCDNTYEVSDKFSPRTLSDIVTVTEFDEPDVVRRAITHSVPPYSLDNDENGLILTQLDPLDTNLHNSPTHSTGNFHTLESTNTFQHQHNQYQNGDSPTCHSVIPAIMPRKIDFSVLINECSSILINGTKKGIGNNETKLIKDSESKLEELKHDKKEISKKKNEKTPENIIKCLILDQNSYNFLNFQNKKMSKNDRINDLQSELTRKKYLIEDLLREKKKLFEDNEKVESYLSNYCVNCDKYLKRIVELEKQMFIKMGDEFLDRDNLRTELQRLSEIHAIVLKDADDSKKEIAKLKLEININEGNMHSLTSKVKNSYETIENLQKLVQNLESEAVILREQNGEHNSKQLSVDEIAKEVEKELNYSAQLDINILKAIESEEDNNTDIKQSIKVSGRSISNSNNVQSDRNFLNKLESLKSKLVLERELNHEIRKELMIEKQHSLEIQEQDMIVIEAMRNRLETAIEKEDNLHKLLNIERNRSDQLKLQLETLQNLEYYNHLSHLIAKSPSESQKTTQRSILESESELVDRLRYEIKLLNGQYTRERKRRSDLQQSNDRDRLRYHVNLQKRIDYSEKVKHEMETQVKGNAKIDIQNQMHELTVKNEEIENLKLRSRTVKKMNTSRPMGWIDRQNLLMTVASLPYVIGRSVQRDGEIAETSMNKNANVTSVSTRPQKFLEKIMEINEILTENTEDNCQMAETVRLLREDRRKLQTQCSYLEVQLTKVVSEMEERCNHLIGRYLRVESHRKALVYQKRYLNISLQSFQKSEQGVMAAIYDGDPIKLQRKKKYLFRTVSLSIIAIQRMKYIARIWHTDKRNLSESL